MSNADMIFGSTEVFLKQIVGVDEVSRDNNGDEPVRYKGATETDVVLMLLSESIVNAALQPEN